MAFSYNKSNLATTTLTAGVTTSDTTITVNDASAFPDTPFYITLMPPDVVSTYGNSEIVLCTAKNGSTFTITRGQRDTIARAFDTGSVVTNAIYSDDLDYAQKVGAGYFNANITLSTPSGRVYAIESTMLTATPNDGMKIRVVFDTANTATALLSTGGSAYPIKVGCFENNTSTSEDATFEAGKLYDLEFYDEVWYVTNITPANPAFTPIKVVEFNDSVEMDDASGAIYETRLKGDTDQQTYTGKNLYNYVPRSGTVQGLSSTYDDETGMIHITGTSNQGWSDITLGYSTSIIPAGQYVMSLTKSVPFTVVFRVTDGNTSQEFAIQGGSTTKTKTITTTIDATSVRIWLGTSNGREYDETFGFMLESGSTATTFEKYVGGTASPNPDYPQDVEVVKGLQTVTISDGGSQTQTYQIDLEGKNKFSTVIEQGSIDAVTGDISNNKRARSKGFVDVLPNTEYTFNLTNNLGSPSLGIAFAYDKNGNYVTQYPSSGWSSMPLTFTTGATIEKIRVVLKTQNEAVVSGSNFSDVQLELGGSDTTYVAYRAIELCKIGNYQDYIYKDSGDWYVHKETGRVAYTSTDVFTTGSSGGYYYFAKARPTDAKPTETCYSNHFIYSSSYTGTDDSVYIGNSNIIFSRVIVGGSYLTGGTDWTSWLAKKTAVVYYVLSTATDTQITDATLISQLDALNDATLNIGHNEISIEASGSNLSGFLRLAYYMDTGWMYKSVYDKNNNGIVDNAEKVNGKTVLSNVPENLSIKISGCPVLLAASEGDGDNTSSQTVTMQIPFNSVICDANGYPKYSRVELDIYAEASSSQSSAEWRDMYVYTPDGWVETDQAGYEQSGYSSNVIFRHVDMVLGAGWEAHNSCFYHLEFELGNANIGNYTPYSGDAWGGSITSGNARGQKIWGRLCDAPKDIEGLWLVLPNCKGTWRYTMIGYPKAGV